MADDTSGLSSSVIMEAFKVAGELVVRFGPDAAEKAQGRAVAFIQELQELRDSGEAGAKEANATMVLVFQIMRIAADESGVELADVMGGVDA